MKIKFKDGIVIECLESDNKSKKEIIEEAKKVHEEIKDGAKIYEITPDLVYKKANTFVAIRILLDNCESDEEGQEFADKLLDVITNDLLEYECDEKSALYEQSEGKQLIIDYTFKQAYITDEELYEFENDLRDELDEYKLKEVINQLNDKNFKYFLDGVFVESETEVDDESYNQKHQNKDSYKYVGNEKVKELFKNGNFSLVKSKGNGEYLDEYLVLEGDKTTDKIDAKNDKEAIKTFKLKFADNLSEEFINKINEEIDGRPFEVYDENNDESYIYYVELQVDGSLCAGKLTNSGISSDYCIKYDNTISLDENLNNLYDIIINDKFGGKENETKI